MKSDSALHDGLVYAFAPIHKLALGVASGLVTGTLLAAVTLFHVIGAPEDARLLGLLSNYFYGYTVSGTGALVGLFWGSVTGFVIGWFAAFVRNLTVTIIVFTLRTKAELEHTADFMDHI